MLQPHPFDFFSKLRWIDGRPLLPRIEPYRRAIFEAAYQHDDGLDRGTPGTASRVKYNLILCGRPKKELEDSRLGFVVLVQAVFLALLEWEPSLYSL